MGHILCVTTGLTGILHASFELVLRLEEAGYQVTYACPREVRDQVTAQGIQYVQLPPVAFDPAPELPSGRGLFQKTKRIWLKIKTARKRREVALDTLEMDHFSTILQRLSPDHLLIDVELHDHIITAVSQGWPTTLLSQWFSLWKRPGLPPIQQATIPGLGWQGSRWGLEWAWWTVKVTRWWGDQKRRFRSVFTDRRSILLYYAKKTGFPLPYIQQNYWPGPFTYSHLPVISMTLWELEFPHIPRPALYYVGPMVHASRKDLNVDAETNRRLSQVIHLKERTGKLLIYCSVSTFKEGDQSFLKRLSKAVAGRPDWLLVIAMGGLLDAGSLGPLPENVYAFSWVPQLKVLEYADCSINHGGIHTINECIHFKVPMLIYSGKRSDQNGCAARIAFHQLGIMADKDQDDVEKIRHRIAQLLKDEGYKTRMNELHTLYHKYKQDKCLAQRMSTLLNDPDQ